MKPDLRSLVRPLLFLVLFNLLPQPGLRPLWSTIFISVLLAYRFWLEWRGGKMPSRWVILIGQIAVSAAIWEHYHSIFGDEAGGTFLTLLLGLKIFELRVKRDFFIAAILCLLVLMSFLLLDQGLVMTIFLFVDVLLILGFMLAVEKERWEWKAWRPALRPSAGLALKAAPVLVLMFLLFPRFSTGFGSGADSTGKTGVTDKLRPGAVAHLISSDELIFRARFLNGEIPPHYQQYWRGAVLNVSHGLNWDRSKADLGKALPVVAPQNPDVEIFLEPGSDKFLFALDSVSAVGFPNDALSRVMPREGQTYELSEPLQTRERYYMQRRPIGELAKADDDPPEDFLEVGEPPSPELRKFLRPMQNLSANETVKGLLDHFHAGGFQYSLQPPPTKGLDDFMFKTKIGFCEHFAGALATLLRDLKVPARVVVGFQGGTPSLLENYVSVRGHDAHAWVEYYDATTSRWRRTDPTAQIAPLRLSVGSESYFANGGNPVPTWMGDWSKSYLRSRAFVDEVEASWTGFLLRFDLARQKEILAMLGMEGVWVRALLVFLILAIALILALIYFFEVRRREPLSVDEKIYRQLLDSLGKWRIAKSPQEGPQTLLAKVETAHPWLVKEVWPILEPLIQARFGRTPLTSGAVVELKRRLRRFRRLKVRKRERRASAQI